MEDHQNSTPNAIGLCLLPSELMQNIFLSLVLPEIIRLKLVSKSFSHLISDHTFVRECNSRSTSTAWLFVYKKRWLRDAVLHAFTDRSNRWFRIPITELLKPIHFHCEDLYFLTASGNVFLFASNTVRLVVAVNLVTMTVKKIPPSPLGPRGTSSWRRSGMKLVTGPPGSDHFRFMFAELVDNRPVLFVYNSVTDKWNTMEAQEARGRHVDERLFLNVVNGPRESVVVACTPECDAQPVIVRPRLEGGGVGEGEMRVGFSLGHVTDRLHVYGDGYMMIVKSESGRKKRVLKGIEMWGVGEEGREWEYISRVPSELMKKIERGYGVMMGCLEERNGVIRASLVSNWEGLWDIVWISFDKSRKEWAWIPLPDCNMKNYNLSGISFSSGITLP
ncbi:F-box protein [Senna tora]|uniref:F-box protein n=1 Tax=Senna tora TaxID=362788 RepID=A0A834W6Y1_9FABA|nr:F-box protein [Senna tora]